MAGVCGSCVLLRRSRSVYKRICNLNLPRHCSTNLIEFLKSNSETFSGKVDEKFTDAKIQNVLQRIVERNVDLDKTFHARKEDLEVPTYKLMTDEEFSEAEKNIKQKALERLQMPPVFKERKDLSLILQENDEIDGHDESNFVFTDISTTCTNRNRRIVVREPNGVLREARWEERDRMNFIYFPRDGQQYELQPMLTDIHLPIVFEQMRHVDVLDLVCVQCMPDSPDYIRVHQRTYDDVDNRKSYYILESTRYHGGMVFYLVSKQRIRGLLLYLVKEERGDDAIDTVKLHHLIHHDSKVAMDAKSKNLDGRDLLIAYAQEEGPEDILSLLSQHEKQAFTV